MLEQEWTELTGVAGAIVFRNDHTGFTVLELDTGEELVTVVGVLPECGQGETLIVRGRHDTHPTFGPQFKAESVERQLPATRSAILQYLSSGSVKGIGPVTAKRIVDLFGEDTLDILEKAPDRLVEVQGISPKKAEKIAEEYRKQFSVRQVMLSLSNWGLTPSESLRIHERFGVACVELIKKNPYILCGEGLHIRFERVDEIAARMEEHLNPIFRVKAGILHVLAHNLYQSGHTCAPRHKVLPLAMSLLQGSEQAVEEAIEALIAEEALVPKRMREIDFLFLQSAFAAESYAAGTLKRILQFPPAGFLLQREEIRQIEEELHLTFADRQRQAMETAVAKGILILTGGPGTGKTTTLKGMIRLFERQNYKIVLAAPTGRAAKRMTELTGMEAKTIHRLLEVEWSNEERQFFARNEKNPLDADVVILDEVSMIDIFLFRSVLEALPLSCRLILVGDAHQLPPVGPGNVLHDLIDSGRLPVIELKEIFRQAMGSLIVTNAHRIVQGEMPSLAQRDSDFFFLKEPVPERAQQTVADLYIRRLPASYGYSADSDIQVLCPSRKGLLGTVQLNQILQKAVNPPGIHKKELHMKSFVLREGDKVMQTKNNYGLEWTRDGGEIGTGIFNGDIGRVETIDMRAGGMNIRFEDRTAFYPMECLGDLELAYAITVHKSQGSEYEAVIMPVLQVASLLCYRNLFYTAVTRAKSLLILLGDAEVVSRMIQNVAKGKRYSGLKTMLCETDATYGSGV